LYVFFENLNAHGGFSKLSLKHQIETSELVIEGKVISKTSVWDDDYRFIYTINTIEVYKVFKGIPVTTVEVITIGGTVGLTALIAHPSLKLNMNDVGLFLLNEKNLVLSRESKTNLKKYVPYGLSQGFYKYNLRENIAANSLSKKSGIVESFYNEIKKHSKENVLELKPFNVNNEIAKKSFSNKLFAPGAITLDKSTVTAGTKEQLTITGTSFGASQGRVFFRNSDDGGATFISALDSEVVSWSDTEIIVEVPSGAGTGTIFIEDSSSDQSPLSSTLTISYAEINIPSDAGGNPLTAYQVRHVDDNTSGGYTWEMQTDFFNETEPGVNTGYKAAFTRALNKWICETGINWTVSESSTAVSAAGMTPDGTNLISFDKSNELGVGALGTSFSWYSGCTVGAPPSAVFWYNSENDLIFNEATNWFTGTGIPGASEFDFESVVLHELGHGHQLAHIIDPVENGNNLDDVMHWNLSNGESQKILTANNIAGANGIQTRSITGPSVCGQTEMSGISCPLSTQDAVLNEKINVFPNPVESELTIENNSLLLLKDATLFDLSGRLIAGYDISGVSKRIILDLSGISSGVYFIKIASDSASISKKLVIK